MKADSLTFLASPGDAPIADSKMNLGLAHLTCSPPWAKNMAEVVGFISQFAAVIKSQERLEVVTSGDEVRSKDGKTQIVLGLQNSVDDIDIKILRDLGVRVLSIAYDGPNRFGSGFANANAPLREDGRDFIRQCNELGMILDLSHSGHRTAEEALQLIVEENLSLGVMASHGGCFDVFPHPRNLPDETLRAIAKLHGYVGIASLTFILDSEKTNALPFMEHTAHALEVCGVDSVGVGSDGVYQRQDEEAWKEAFGLLVAKLDKTNAFHPFWPDQPLCFNSPERMDTLYQIMTDLMHGNEIARRVTGENFCRFLTRNLK